MSAYLSEDEAECSGVTWAYLVRGTNERRTLCLAHSKGLDLIHLTRNSFGFVVCEERESGDSWGTAKG